MACRAKVLFDCTARRLVTAVTFPSLISILALVQKRAWIEIGICIFVSPAI
jgi:hypothetical protein